MMQTAASENTSLKLLVMGFTDNERRLLQSIVMLSKRRTPSLQLVDVAAAAMADVILVDAQNTEAMNWALAQPWLKNKPVGWVDLPGETAPSHTKLSRPVQWPILPTLLSRIMFAASPGAAGAGGQKLGQGANPAPARSGPSLNAPAQAPPEFRQETAIIDPPPLSGQKRVLVVDDSKIVRQQLQNFLAKKGISAQFAESGNEAIERCRQERFDCLLLDVLMPGMDGYETCRRIKALPNMAKKVKVVMLTSKSSPFDRIRGKMAGCDSYLTKPVEAQKLYATLSQHLRA